jgi:hypothetical protein
MNWSEINASWNELRALVQTRWPKLSYVVLDDVNGDRAELGRALQYHYESSAGDAELAICKFEKDVRRPGAVTPACH